MTLSLLLLGGLACKKASHPFYPPNESAADRKQEQLDWNLQTMVDVYKHSANTNADWDGFVVSAFQEFARARANMVDTYEPWAQIVGTNAAAAVDQIRFTYGTHAEAYELTGPMRTMMSQNLELVLADRTTPPEEVLEAAQRDLSLTPNNEAYRKEYWAIKKPIFAQWPDDSASWIFKGYSCFDMAWAARGNNYSSEVKEDSWKTFFDDLEVAENALTNAWQLDPHDERIPIKMIGVAEGLQKGRSEMEMWFQRAMTINPNCYEACADKLHYLYPQWYGSREDMIAFGRECVALTTWGGNVPLILSAAHREYWLYLQDKDEKSSYWKQPDVWPDVRDSFERFFALNPQATAYYHNYAWFAYQCEQWGKLNELIPKLVPVNYSYFGGKDEFDKMVRLAREHAGTQNLQHRNN